MADSKKEWIVLVVLFSTLVLALGILSVCIRIQKKHEAQKWKEAYFKNRRAADLEKQTGIVRHVGAAGINRSHQISITMEALAVPSSAMLRS